MDGEGYNGSMIHLNVYRCYDFEPSICLKSYTCCPRIEDTNESLRMSHLPTKIFIPIDFSVYDLVAYTIPKIECSPRSNCTFQLIIKETMKIVWLMAQINESALEGDLIKCNEQQFTYGKIYNIISITKAIHEQINIINDELQ